MDKPYVEIEGSEYHDCVILDEYNGKLSLCSGNVKDGEAYMRWCFPQAKDRQPGAKSIPWKITIGESKAQAIRVLEAVIADLKGGATEPPTTAEGKPFDDDDIPF